jgi:hypothetical protein
MYNSTCSVYNTVDGICNTTGTWTYNSTELGNDYNIVTEINKQLKEKDYFITTSGEYSQIWRVEDINNEYKVELRDIGSDNTLTLSLGSISGTASLSLGDGSTATIQLDTANTIVLKDKASNYLYTNKGAEIIMPTNDTGTIQVLEETSYYGGEFHNNKGILLGNALNFTYTYKKDRSGKEIFLKTANLGVQNTNIWSQDVGDNDIYSMTKYGTFVKQTGNDDKRIQIYYPENAMRVNFYIGEQGSEITSDGTDISVSNILAIKDSEIDSYRNRNMVVVGGSCINAVAASLLGSPVPLCGDEWQALTDVSAGHYLVQVLKNPWATTTDKTAILVAGYNAEDTTKGVNDILNTPMNLSIGSRIIG